jgi:hypothetical protein
MKFLVHSTNFVAFEQHFFSLLVPLEKKFILMRIFPNISLEVRLIADNIIFNEAESHSLTLLWIAVLGSEEEAFWRKQHPNGYKILDSPFIKEKTTSAHQAAVQNRPDLLAMLLEDNPELVNAKDVNGWTPLHVSTVSMVVCNCIKILAAACFFLFPKYSSWTFIWF